MIIKIITQISGAVYYDELEKVKYEMINYEQFSGYGFNAIWTNDDLKAEYEKAVKEENPIPFICVITARRRKINDFTTEDELSIATTMTTYLLNDEGRTIERIH